MDKQESAIAPGEEGEEDAHTLQPDEEDEFDCFEGGEEGDDEKSDSFTGMSAADKKKHKLEYAKLLCDIEEQNRTVENLKNELFNACDNPCLTKCQLREIKKLRSSLEDENLKLQCMVKAAIKMQNEIPSQCWDAVPIVASIEDEVFPSMRNCDVMTSLGLRSTKPEPKDDHDCSAKKEKRKKKPCSDGKGGDVDSSQLLQEICIKDQLIKRLTCKLKSIQTQMQCCSNKTKKPPKPPKPCSNMENHMEYLKGEVDNLKQSLKCLCKENEPVQEECRSTQGKKKPGSEIQKMREKYAQLLCCISMKDTEIRELKGRIKGYCGGAGTNSSKSDVSEAELKLLREKVDDMKDEQEEYKCIIKEQSEQLDDYRRKYMDSQQKVEEQKGTLLKIEMDNKRIEAQIEAELKRIKANFKEQLAELSEYPKLLENEQIKLASAVKERDELEGQLRLVCKELKSMKENMLSKPEKPDCAIKLASVEKDLVILQGKIDELTKEKEIVSEELVKAKLDLDTMRCESAKIITNTKERFEMTKFSMNSRIDTLEKELAQCRASASLSITDREAVIKEMQSQLSTLSYSFDSAQKQIKTLKNHISFLSNDQCIPIKC